MIYWEYSVHKKLEKIKILYKNIEEWLIIFKLEDASMIELNQLRCEYNYLR